MTRIFDALKKSRTSRGPASAVPPAGAGPRGPVAPIPTRPGAGPVHGGASALRAHAVHDAGPGPLGTPVPFTQRVDLPEEVVREMTTLRMSVEAELVERLPRVVMFVSAQRGEGTSTIASQFAAVVARDEGPRVLLVDLNARRPAWRAPAPESASADPRTFDLLPLPDSFVRSGVVPADALRTLGTAMAAAYDWIVVDGPPVLDAPDAVPLAAAADGIIVVIEAGRAKRPVLNRAVDLLRKAGGRLLGSVLNRRRLEIPDFIYRRI